MFIYLVLHQQITVCEFHEPGDIISWEASSYKLVGNVNSLQNNFTYTDICKPTSKWRRVFTTNLRATQTRQLCQKINGTQTVIRNEVDHKKYEAFFAGVFKANPEVESKCDYTDLGSKYGPVFRLAQHKTEGPIESNSVTNPYNGDIIKYVRWLDGFPNANFVNKDSYHWIFTYNGEDSKYIHAYTYTPLCFTCDGVGSLVPVLKMRGLCQGSQFDKNYVLAYNSENILFYQGDRHTNITYNVDKNLWVITSNSRTEGGLQKDKPVKGFSKVKDHKCNNTDIYLKFVSPLLTV